MKLLRKINRVLCTGDVHARNGPRGELDTSRQLLQSLGHTALREGCDTLLVNGDLWDEKHGVRTEVHVMVWREVVAWASEHKLNVILVRGNHEVDLDKNTPTLSLIKLYHHPEANIHVINTSTKLCFPGGCLWFIPWYGPDEWLKWAKKYADEAKGVAGMRVLFSHIGIKEGTVSSSNIYTVNSRTSLIHLRPEEYDWVILGDYHKKQDLTENCFYTGCPIPLSHGDLPTQGVVVLDLTEGTVEDVELHEANSFPVYRTVRIAEDCQVPFVLYPPSDYVRIQAPHEMAQAIRSLYPHPRWEVDGYATQQGVKVTATDRLAAVAKSDYEQVLGVWLSTQGLTDPRYRKMGMEYLGQAVEVE